MSTYLTSDELADLVGCKPNQRVAMAKWLDKNHWPYVVDRNGLPKVSRAYHDARLSGAPTRPTYATEPNLDALKREPTHPKRK